MTSRRAVDSSAVDGPPDGAKGDRVEPGVERGAAVEVEPAAVVERGVRDAVVGREVERPDVSLVARAPVSAPVGSVVERDAVVGREVERPDVSLVARAPVSAPGGSVVERDAAVGREVEHPDVSFVARAPVSGAVVERDAAVEGDGSIVERDDLRDGSSVARDDRRAESGRADLPALRLRAGGELGRGGMGVVTAAFDPVLERTVALKRPLVRGVDGEARLLREAKLSARLDHPAIVSVLDVGRDEEGRLAAVLPVRAGRSLGEAVAAGAPLQELLRALLIVAQAVAYAHARGVLHRDLSPGNVRLGEEGAVWVIDWGLAATLDEARAGGFSGGTRGYTSPELRAGLPAAPTADVWSLGALLHLVCAGTAPGQVSDAGRGADQVALAGAGRGAGAGRASVDRSPWGRRRREVDQVSDTGRADVDRNEAVALAGAGRAEQVEAVARAVAGQSATVVVRADAGQGADRPSGGAGSRQLHVEELARPRGCPAPLWAIAQRALAASPARRYPDAHAFAADLARWLDGQPVDAWPEGPLSRLARRARRAPRLTAGIVLAVVVVLATVTTGALQVASAQQRARRATAALLVDSAERALHEDDVTTARRLATEALSAVDSPRARGVLAATARVSSVQLTSLEQGDAGVVLDESEGAQLVLRGDELVVVAAGEQRTAGRGEQGALLAARRVLTVSRARAVVELRDLTGAVTSVALPGGNPDLRVAHDRGVAVVTVPERVVQVTHELRAFTPCSPGQAVRFAIPRARGLEVLCADEELVSLDAAGTITARRAVLGLSTLLRGAVTGDLIDDDTLVLGNAQGQVGLVSLSAAVVLGVAPSGLGFVRAAVASRDGRAVALVGERGMGVWRMPEGHLLPGPEGELDDVRAVDDGFVLRRGAQRWKLTSTERLSVATNLHGRSALAVHEGSRRVAVGDARGTVELFSLDTGALAKVTGPSRVIKSLAFSASGRWLAMGAAGAEGVMVFDTSGARLSRVAGDWEGRPGLRGRHVLFVGEDLLLVFSWGGGPWAARWNPARAAFVEEPMPAMPADVRGVVSDGDAVEVLDATGGWTSLRGVVKEEARWSPAPWVVAGSRGKVVTALAERVERRGEGRAFEAGAPVEGLALAADGRLAVCRRDGAVELRDRADQLLLEVRAFEGRCGRVVFCDGDRALCAVGWDGRLRILAVEGE